MATRLEKICKRIPDANAAIIEKCQVLLEPRCCWPDMQQTMVEQDTPDLMADIGQVGRWQGVCWGDLLGRELATSSVRRRRFVRGDEEEEVGEPRAIAVLG